MNLDFGFLELAVFLSNFVYSNRKIEDDMNGKVKWFDNKKGFGFIIADEDSKEIFVHYTDIVKEGFKTLDEGQRVTYELGDGAKGPQAVNVTVIE